MPQPYNGGAGISQPQRQVAQPPPQAAGRLTGRVKSIVFDNEDSDGSFFYIVAVEIDSLEGVTLDGFSTDRPIVTGRSFTLMHAGMKFECDVNIVNHSSYGKQFNTQLFRGVRPNANSEAEWIAALANMGIRGIGKANAAKIVKHMGGQGMVELTAAEHDVVVQRLMEVPGIGCKKATAIAKDEIFRDQGRAEALGKLHLAGINPIHAQELVNRYPGRNQAHDLLLKDPYYLCWHLGGSLKYADSVAMNINFRGTSVLRSWFALREAQREATRSSGNTCSSLLSVLNGAQTLLNHSPGPLQGGGAAAPALQLSTLRWMGMKYTSDGSLKSIAPNERFPGDRLAASQDSDTLFDSDEEQPNFAQLWVQFGDIWFPLKVAVPIGEQASPSLASMHVTGDSADAEQGLTLTAKANESGRVFVDYCDAAAIAAARAACGASAQAEPERFPWAKALSYSHPLWESERRVVDILIRRLEEGASNADDGASTSQPRSLEDNLRSQNSALHLLLARLADDASLSRGQREAIVTALLHPIAILTGGPGCGKTETLRTLAALLARSRKVVNAPYGLHPVRMAGCAPTGRAASRMGDAMGFNCSSQTMHRLARLYPQRKTRLWVNGNDDAWENTVLELLDIVAVDELSMVGVNLFSRFLHRYLEFLELPTFLDHSKLNGIWLELSKDSRRARDHWEDDSEDSDSDDSDEEPQGLELVPRPSLDFDDLGLLPGKRLLLVGDPDQLPSIDAGLVLRDLIESGVIPVIDLRLIFRQAADSDIVKAAFEIKQGRCPALPELSIAALAQPAAPSQPPWGPGNAFLIPAADLENTELAIQKLLEHLECQGFDMLQDVQVVTPYRKSQKELSVAKLNPLLQELLNPKSPGDREIDVHGWGILRAGTKVLQIKNVYSDVSSDVFNGDVGFVECVRTEARKIKTLSEIMGRQRISKGIDIPEPAGKVEMVDVADITFVRGSGRRQYVIKKTYDMHDLKELTQMGWATTVHKMQGCEARVVILIMSDLHFRGWTQSFFTKELLYTGVTRARDLLFVVGSQRALERMVALRFEKRTSILSDRLFFAAQRAGLPQHPFKCFGDSQ